MATANLGRVGFVNKGTYNGATAYKVNDVVTYNAGTYACIQANTGQAPTNTSYWQNWVADNAIHKTGDETKSGVLTLSDGLKLQGLNVSPYSGFKNYIINGGFDIWQRGTSFSRSGYSSDRWYFNTANGIVGSFSRNEIAGAFPSSVTGGNKYRGNLNITTGPSTVTSVLEQRIEKPWRLSGKTVTVSFYLSCSAIVGNMWLNFYSNTVKSSGADINSNILTLNSSNITSAVTRFTATFTFPTFDGYAETGSEHISLRFVAGAGFTCSNFLISGAQLEEGSVATPFEQRPYGLELSLCQRYLPYRNGLQTYTYFGKGTAETTTSCYVQIPIKNTARIAPTSVTYNGNLHLYKVGYGSYAVTGISINSSFTTAEYIVLNVTVASGLTVGNEYSLIAMNDATAYIEISTEL